MKLKSKRSAAIILVGMACLLPSSGIAAPDETVAARTDGDYARAGEIVARVSTDLRNCEFERRDEFIAHYRSKHDKLSANIEQLRVRHSAALASPQLNAAMDKLSADVATFEQKLSEAEDATAETWNAARDSVAASWDELQTSYSEVSDGG